MNTLGPYHDQFVIRAQGEGGDSGVGGLQGDDNSVRQKADNSVCSIVLSIRLELKVAGGEKHFSTILVNRAWQANGR